MVANGTAYGGEFVTHEPGASWPAASGPLSSRLVSPRNASALDREASDSWGLSPFALVEAAGRACAAALKKIIRWEFSSAGTTPGPLLVLAGPGNNGADALVALRAMLAQKPYNAAVLLSRFPAADENSPRSAAVKALRAMGVPVLSWNGAENAAELFQNARLIIDGIAGTGIEGPLGGTPLEMLAALKTYKNSRRPRDGDRRDGALVVSIDVPSGASDYSCTPDFPGAPGAEAYPLVEADYTLAIEPLKTILYTPSIRPYCGTIIPVRGIFPQALLERYGGAELLDWENVRSLVPPVAPDSYKYSRGVVEIHAGSTGSAGAARLAAEGASAAGAGLVRLVLDDELYPALAPAFGGIMALPASSRRGDGRFAPDVLLLGPGWGKGENRRAMVKEAAAAEASGTPLILDADAITLFKDYSAGGMLEGRDDEGAASPLPVFHGNALLTPHAGELEKLSGISKTELLSRPERVAELATAMNAAILFKSHVMMLASPDGSLRFIDGMEPALGAGGSGDVLAGLCAGIAARLGASQKYPDAPRDPPDRYGIPALAAAAAGTLLIAASRSAGRRFYDPMELASRAAVLAGEAWLPAAASSAEKLFAGDESGEP